MASDAYSLFAPPPSFGNPMTALGDLIYGRDAAGDAGRLAIGSAGQVLQVVGGIPTWAAVALSSLAPGTTPNQPLIWSGTAWATHTLDLSAITPGGFVNLPMVYTSGGWSNTALTLAGLAQSGATAGQVPAWSGSAWSPVSPAVPPIAGVPTISGVHANISLVQLEPGSTGNRMMYKILTSPSSAVPASNSLFTFTYGGAFANPAVVLVMFCPAPGDTMNGSAQFPGGIGVFDAITLDNKGYTVQCTAPLPANSLLHVAVWVAGQ